MPHKEFSHTGSWQRFDIPKKVEWVEVVVDGAGSNGIPGGRVTGQIRVKGRKALLVLVGAKGTRGGDKGTGGSGRAGTGVGGKGWSGGGGSFIRVDSRTGALRAVAGGAGGTSSDGGLGGEGGGDVAGAGAPAPNYPDGTENSGQWFYPTVGNATGGTQIQGGNGGKSALDTTLAGGDSSDAQTADGGNGGSSKSAASVGGGGGGGGFFGGGGGQAGITDLVPAGGGGGGSSYVGGITGYTNARGGGATGHGSVTISWVSPAPANQPPAPPTEVKVGGRDYSEEMATLSKGKVEVTARISDPNSKKVRIVAYYAPNDDFRGRKVLSSDWVKRGKRGKVELEGLSRNTLWHLRLYTRDEKGLLSTRFTALRFWTDRPPSAPNLVSPGDNATIPSLDSPVFSWTHVDPDHPNSPTQKAFEMEWRRAGTAVDRPGEWLSVRFTTPDETYVGESAAFKANNTYEWRVRTRDEQNLWGDWSEIRSFYVSGTTAPPWPVSPSRGEAADSAEPVTFEWEFRDPNPGADQRTADIRFRQVDSGEWTNLPGDSLEPGPLTSRTLDLEALLPGHYEWQVRTLSNLLDTPSDWSDSERFFVVRTPGATAEEVIPPSVVSIESRLGCGNNEVHVYRRGGQVYVGHITPLVDVTWTRKRDDISNCLVSTNGTEKSALLDAIEPWVHELVVFRDGERVWEGPVVRATDEPDGFHIEAKDVLGYAYRRILRQGYNDSYRVTNNVQLGLKTVVQRARQIIMNALAPDDPNVLGYLTSFDFHDDARQSRSVPDFAKMAWEEVDDMAATAGLDYVAVGRRIMLWDTHRPIGRLPEFRSHHFSSPPVISKYGMLLATDFGVTNNAGQYGLATRRESDGHVPAYGLVEQLASAYGETEAPAGEKLTSVQQANLERTLTTQAERNISNRYPTPKIVRVPDNSTLDPETPVKINYLVPGVWIPLRAQGVVSSVAMWQKLDVVTVTQTSAGEQVSVVMSPAPNNGSDPDAETSAEAEA